MDGDGGGRGTERRGMERRAGAVADAAEAFADDGASRVPARRTRASLVMGRTGQTFGRRAGRGDGGRAASRRRVCPGDVRVGRVSRLVGTGGRGVARGGGKHVAAPSRACNAPFLITVVEPQRAER